MYHVHYVYKTIKFVIPGYSARRVSYTLPYIVGFGLVEITISINPNPTISGIVREYGPSLVTFLFKYTMIPKPLVSLLSGGPRVVVSTAAFHARARGSVPGLGGLKETKCFFPIHV